MKTITKILILSLLVILSACGTRKAAIEKLKVNVTTKEAETVNLVEKEKTTSESTDKIITTKKVDNDISQKDQKTEVKEKFVDGQLTERTTVTTTSDKVDKSKSENKEDKTSEQKTVNEVLKNLEKTANKIVDSMIKSNAKEIDANNTIVKNFGGWAIMVLMALIVIGSIWYWIKNKNK